MPVTAKPGQILLRFRPTDNANGVSRKTLARLAKTLGVNETQIMHYALKKLARAMLPAYEPDEGDLATKAIGHQGAPAAWSHEVRYSSLMVRVRKPRICAPRNFRSIRTMPRPTCYPD